MTVAFDYDDTWTLDPEGWESIYRILVSRGHRCIMVTAREANQNADMKSVIQLFGEENVFYSSVYQKDPFMSRLGVHVNVWIDDDPDGVIFTYKNDW